MTHSRRLLGILAIAMFTGVLAFAPTPPARVLAAAPAPVVPFTLPPGFVAEKVAGPPLVEHPVMGNFDEKGRFFVADNGGTNQPAAQLLKDLPSVIRCLEDTDGDGKFDTSKVFADKMAFPMGALWHRGALYTMAAPSLWKLEDTDGDGVADKRTELITKFGFTGNAADVHGPWLGPDGRLYFTQGRHGHEVKLPSGEVIKGKAARIFRCKTDGSEFERICGGGFDNPVELAFTDEGEPFAVVNILHGSPARHDAIIYCIDGGAWPYYEPVMGEFKRTGDLLPPVTDLGWVAPSGLTRYRSDVFGKEYQGNLFSTQFNTHKVMRHILERDGAGFKCKNEDFLVSTDPDFHPTCVREDADGSLIVIDTGGWFRIGCPTSQIAKPQVKGAIWRIRKKGAAKVEDPWGLKLSWQQPALFDLVARLDDPRWAVRDRSGELLGQLPTDDASTLRRGVRTDTSPLTVRGQTHALHALGKVDVGDGAQLRVCLRDVKWPLRLVAARAVGLQRDTKATRQLVSMVAKDESLAVRREAAIALGRIRSSAAVPGLILGLQQIYPDRLLEHALVHALIEINDRALLVPALRDPKPSVRRAALVALDQMDAGNLTPDLVKPLLDSDDAELQKTVWWVVSRRPAWAGEMVQWLRQALTAAKLNDAKREQLRDVLVQFSKNAEVQKLIAELTADKNAPDATRLLLLEVMAAAAVDKLPAPWIASLRFALASPDERLVRQAIATVRARNVNGVDEVLLEVAGSARRQAELRVQALAAVVARLPTLSEGQFQLLRGRLAADLPSLDKLAAAEALGRAPVSDAQLDALSQLIPDAGALEMPHLVSAFERARNPEIGKKLIAALGRCKSLPALTPDRLRAALANYPDAVRQSAEPIYKILSPDLDKQKARLAELEPLIGNGNIAQGRVVFFGQKAVCSACHTAEGRGGKVGPDLSKIAGIRTGRDLLEAIVFPSASIVRGYEPVSVATKEGKALSGLIARETPDALFLINADRLETRIPRATIDAVEPARVSIMPQGIDGQLTPTELADLLAYLQSLK